MQLHANAKLGPAGRRELVRRIEEGDSLRAAAEERRICAARRRTGWGPRLLSGVTGHPHATVSKVLRRHGLSRPRRAPREPARRYEWPCPGDLLHVDTKRYARFGRACASRRAGSAFRSRRSGDAMSSGRSWW
jgi:hypothetical protein